MLAKQMPWQEQTEKCFVLKVHGGLGDAIWLEKKACNFNLPLHLCISNENRSRPRRAAPLIEHMPNVISYNYDLTAFCENGEDWPHPDDPCCAIGKKFSDLNIQPNVPFRLECNRWLEGGRRIEGWLPDIPTTHHFDFRPCGPPTFEIQNPCIVLHLAGWPDVPDSVWISAADAFRSLCHVYIVGGSYDFRPRRVYESASRCMPGVTLIEDTAWENIVGLLKTCSYCFGHASGFTAVADVLRVSGVVFNPRSVPRLTGTWNSLENSDCIQVDQVRDFENAIGAAYKAMETGDRSTWPASARRGPRLSAAKRPGCSASVNAARSAGELGARSILIWSSESETQDEIPAEVLKGAYDAGRIVNRLHVVGFGEEALLEVYKQSMRSTRRPTIDSTPFWGSREEHEAYDLAVLCVSSRLAEAANQVRQAWSLLSPKGTLLVGGAAALPAIESLGSTLRSSPTEVENSPNWFYLHRRL